MSRHEAEVGELKYVFGWDQPLMSFFLQVHNTTYTDEDNNPFLVLGATQETMMREVEDLVKNAQVQGLHIDRMMQTILFAEKDEGI